MKKALVFVVFTFSMLSVSSQYNSTDWHSVELDSAELAKVAAIKALIPSDSILLFIEKYDIWQESVSGPEYQGHSNPNAYKNDEYYDFAAFTRRQGPAYIGLLIDFFIDHHVGIDYYLLLDITLNDYLPLLDDAKEVLYALQNPPDGERVYYTQVSLAYLYFKEILAKIRIESNEGIFDFIGWCDIDPWVMENYYIDANILALREIYADEDHPFRDNVGVSSELIWKYMGILSSIIVEESANRDSVFYLYPIHTFNDVPSEIVMMVDYGSEWLSTYLEDSLHSGNKVLDSILTYFHFKFQSYIELGEGGVLSIETSLSMNLLPLVAELEQLDGILSCEAVASFAGDGNNIRTSQSGDTVFIDFSIAWGDCPSGCTARHQWNFIVKDCSASFVDWTGERIEGFGYPYETPRGYDPLVDSTKQWNFLVEEYDSDEFVKLERISTIVERFRGDTILDNKKYSFLEMCWNDSTFSQWQRSNFLFREDLRERKVYVRSADKDDLLYDFSLGVGDTLRLNRDFVVDSIENDSFFANKRRQKVFFSEYEQVFEMIEGIGTMSDLLAPYHWMSIGNSSSSTLMCLYQRGELLYQKEDYCYFYRDYTGYPEKEGQQAIIIYPNPASDNITVEINQPGCSSSLSFYSIDGKLLKSVALESQKQVIPIHDLKNGPCLLVISRDGEATFRQLIVVVHK